MDLRPPLTAAPVTKVMFNVGALFDIPTGVWMRGFYGENILNGGLGALTGFVGIGNHFKSTILKYMILSAMDKVMYTHATSFSTYDTEVNIHESHLEVFCRAFPNLAARDVFADGTWIVTDKTVYDGNKWFEVIKLYLAEKKKAPEKEWVETPFANREKTGPLKILPPTFGELDSITEFQSEAELKMLDENELGESGAQTFHMRSGLVKQRLLMELPALTAGAYHYMGITAQLGKDGPSMATGPAANIPIKKLQYLKNGDRIKGATDKFTFATTACWHAYNCAPLVNQTTKAAEYPVAGQDPFSGDTDLNLVSLRMLRSKSGPSGFVIEVIVSQRDGVLPSLTEFHFIKSMDRYGINGTMINYELDLYPGCKLSRTSVRSKIDADVKLRQALLITSQMCQMKYYMPAMRDSLECTPKQLYDDLVKLGYDWDEILSCRGYFTLNTPGNPHPIPYLSTMDLLLIREGTYDGPYKKGWLKAATEATKEALAKAAAKQQSIANTVKEAIPA